MKIPEFFLSKIVERKLISNKKKELISKTIVFTNGCFDILHLGHVIYLYEARSLGDFLWVGLNSDLSVQRLKGSSRPINNQIHRAILLASLSFIDAVTIFEEENPISLIQEICPNIHVKGGDYKKEDLIEYETVVACGGRVEILPFVEGHSTTQIIQKIFNQTKD